MSRLASILYIAAVLRARPRAIDRYIDYFGDRMAAPREVLLGECGDLTTQV